MAHQFQEHTQGRILPSEIQIQALRGELDAANKRVDRYIHLVASLSEELDNLRRSICYNCKKKFVPSYAPVGLSLDGVAPRPLVSSRSQAPSSGLPPISPANPGQSFNMFIPIPSITIQENQTNSAILYPHASPSTIPRQPSATPAVQSKHYAPVALSSDVGHPRPSLWHRIGQKTQTLLSGRPVLPMISERPHSTSITIRSIAAEHNQTSSAILAPLDSSAIPPRPSVDEIQSEKPDWSVSHNPEIKQALHVDLVKTFNFTAVVSCVKFSPDGKYLAVGLGSKSGKTYIYDMETGLKICCLVDLYPKVKPTIWCIQFSPDNKYIATTSGQHIRLWEIARKRTQVAFPADSLSLCFSPNGRFLVVGDGLSVCIFSLRDGSSKTLLNNRTGTFSTTFSPDGRHIASVDFGCWLRLWDARSGQLLDIWNANSQVERFVAFSPDGRGLLSGGGNGILRYWDVSSLAHMKGGRDQVIGGIPGQRFPQIRKFEGHTSWIQAISFSLDYRWIATCSTDKTVRIWNPHTAERQCTLYGHDAYARTVDFCPVGKYLASGGEDGQVRLWEYLQKN